MNKEIKILVCDRCGKTISENDNLNILKLYDHDIDLCDSCNDRFHVWWNYYLKPDLSSDDIRFKPNENLMFKNDSGEPI